MAITDDKVSVMIEICVCIGFMGMDFFDGPKHFVTLFKWADPGCRHLYITNQASLCLFIASSSPCIPLKAYRRHTCQALSGSAVVPKLHTFFFKTALLCIALPGAPLLNRHVNMGFMYLYGAPVLHIFQKRTNFSPASFTANVRICMIWDNVVMNWANMFAGCPWHIQMDQSSAFCSFEMVLLFRHSSAKGSSSGTKGNSSLGHCETIQSII